MLSFLQLRLQGSFDLLCGRDIEPVNSDAPLSERSVGAAPSGQSVLRRDQMNEPERQFFDQPAPMRPIIEAAHGADTIVDSRPRIGPPRVRAWSLQHAVAICSDSRLVGGPPVEIRLLQRVEPVVEMLSVSAHRLGRMRTTKNRCVFDQVCKGRSRRGRRPVVGNRGARRDSRRPTRGSR